MLDASPSWKQLLSCSPHLLEGGQQLDAHVAQLVPPHMLQQEGILLQVFIGEVELNLVHQLPDELLVGRLPLLLQVLMLILAPTCGAAETRRRQRVTGGTCLS